MNNKTKIAIADLSNIYIVFIKYLFIFLFFPFFVSGQNNTEPDSLKKLLHRSKGIEKVQLYNKIAGHYLYIAPDSMVYYAQKALGYIADHNLNISKAPALLNIGIAYSKMNKFKKAEEFLQMAMKVAKESDDTINISKTYNILGIINWQQNNFETAIHYYFETLKIEESHSDSLSVSKTFCNIGTLYHSMDEPEKAVSYFYKALSILYRYNDKLAIARTLSNIGYIHYKLKEYDSALFYYEKSLPAFEDDNQLFQLSGTNNNIGLVYEDKEQLDKALDYYLIALKIAEENGFNRSIARTSDNIAKIYIKQNKYDDALLNLEKTITYAKETNSNDILKNAYFNYFFLYEKMGRLSKAIFYYKKHITMKDSIFNEEKHKQIAELQTKYDTEKKEKENLLFKNNIDKQQLKLSRNRIIINSMTMGILTAIILLIIIIYLYRKRTIAYQYLVVKNLELARCDKEILEKGNLIHPDILKKSDTNEPELKKDLELIDKFNRFLTGEKPYLLNNINIDDVCSKIGSNRTYLSNALKAVYNKSFNTIINEHRIRVARQLLTDPKYDHLSIEGIGEMVGYKTRAAFHKNFKKLTGLTPSYFKASVLK